MCRHPVAAHRAPSGSGAYGSEQMSIYDDVLRYVSKVVVLQVGGRSLWCSRE